MGRIVFFLALAFCAILAIRIVAKLRRGDPAEAPPSTKPADESAPTEPATPVLALKPCPLCALHLPSDELAAHLKQAHGAA